MYTYIHSCVHMHSHMCVRVFECVCIYKKLLRQFGLCGCSAHQLTKNVTRSISSHVFVFSTVTSRFGFFFLEGVKCAGTPCSKFPRNRRCLPFLYIYKRIKIDIHIIRISHVAQKFARGEYIYIYICIYT